MKRLILIAAFILTAGTLAAQNYIIVNSEKVFKSVAAYNKAISDLDELAKQYQEQVDAKFAEVEALYNAYMNQKASLSATTRQTRENAILAREKEAQTRSRRRSSRPSKPTPSRPAPTWCSTRRTIPRCSIRIPVWSARSS